MALVRHFTATGYVVHDGHVALHWHPKVKEWLPPGGHVEENEDPVQAVLREIREETGVDAQVVPTGESFELTYPEHVHPPLTIMVEDIHDPVVGCHQHIDMIYVCRPLGRVSELNDGWRWVSESDLAKALHLPGDGSRSVRPPHDVRTLAARAFKIVAKAG